MLNSLVVRQDADERLSFLLNCSDPIVSSHGQLPPRDQAREERTLEEAR